MTEVLNLAAALAAASLLLVATSARAADESAPPMANVTFTRDVAPILFKNCIGCHRPGEIAPMSLLSYEEARPWIKSIRKAVVEEKTMPPWHADPAHGKFKNERRLTAAQIETIDQWIRQGAPKGDEKQMPAPPKFVEGWQLGEPDYVIEFGENQIPADGPDSFANLFTIADLKEDRWVKAIEIRPSARQVVHHVIAILVDEKNPQQSVQGWLGAWAAGTAPMQFPEGTGRLVKNGSRIMVNMHFHPNGQPATNTTRIGLHFAKGPVKQEIVNLWVQNGQFQIPAGDPNHEVRATYTFPEDSRIVTVGPHMHYRGKDMLIKAVFPDGKEKILINVPKYDFNWQTIYELQEPVAMPKGSKVEVLAHFDNSTKNPANPDPNKNVTFGLSSTDEMMIGFIDYVAEGSKGTTPAGS